MNQIIGYLRLVTLIAFASLGLARSELARAAIEHTVKETDRRAHARFPESETLQRHNSSGDVHITGTTGNDLLIKAVRGAGREHLEMPRETQ
jgi:hypothetical protein